MGSAAPRWPKKAGHGGRIKLATRQNLKLQHQLEYFSKVRVLYIQFSSVIYNIYLPCMVAHAHLFSVSLFNKDCLNCGAFLIVITCNL